MARERAEQIIRGVMYGAPGEDHDSASGRRPLLGVLEQMGLSALADEAVVRLAAAHQAEDERETNRALCEARMG
jgi:hypothetical protein